MNESPFKCRHGDPRCEDDPCPAGIRWLCETRDSGRLPKGEDTGTVAECEASQSGRSDSEGIAQTSPGDPT